MTLGQRMRAIREERGYSQVKLAKMLHTHSKCISVWENDKVRPSPDNITRIAKALNVPVSELTKDLWLAGNQVLCHSAKKGAKHS